MLRFAIGVGIRSVAGGDIEQLLHTHYELDEFVVHPFFEREYEVSNLENIQRRAIAFANRLSEFYKAKTYIGVASSIVRHSNKTDSGLVRHDMITGLERNKDNLILCWALNPEHKNRQLREKVCARVSGEESLKMLLMYTKEWCKVSVKS